MPNHRPVTLTDCCLDLAKVTHAHETREGYLDIHFAHSDGYLTLRSKVAIDAFWVEWCAWEADCTPWPAEQGEETE